MWPTLQEKHTYARIGKVMDRYSNLVSRVGTGANCYCLTSQIPSLSQSSACHFPIPEIYGQPVQWRACVANIRG